MSKYCKKCGILNENPLSPFCKEHYFEREKAKPVKIYEIKRSEKPINKISKTNKNNIAKFSSKTKAEILIRDKHCIFCENAIQDYHHIYFGGNAEYGPDRNNVDKGVGVCRFHHNKFHHARSGDSKKMKEHTIKYINEKKL